MERWEEKVKLWVQPVPAQLGGGTAKDSLSEKDLN